MTFCDEHGTADYCGECVYGPELESLQQQLAAAQAEIECEERRFSEQQDLLHSVIQERDAAQAEARELRAELARVRELIGVWRRMHKAAVQVNDGHETAHHAVLKTCADQLDAALSRAAERESLPLTFTQGVLCSLSILDGYGDSIAYREVANPHDLNQLWEEADEFDREHLARHGYRPTPAAQESGQ